MNNSFRVIGEETKLNKKKVFFAILLILIIIAFCIYAGIKTAQEAHQKELKEEQERLAIQQKIEEQKRIEEEKRLEEERKRIEEENKKQKANQPTTEEQLQAIENIYSDVGEKRVFLTFDDGPTESVTPLILDLLKEENIKATFFVLGNRAKANPELIQREYNEGHYVANHGYSHNYSQIYSDIQNVLDEYNYTNNVISEILNIPNYNSRVFRFPGGSNGGKYHTLKQQAKQYLRDNGIASLDWNCLSRDAEGANTIEQLFQNVVDTMGDKQSLVILMHDASDKILTYEALKDIINYLRDDGYKFVNLYDIL